MKQPKSEIIAEIIDDQKTDAFAFAGLNDLGDGQEIIQVRASDAYQDEVKIVAALCQGIEKEHGIDSENVLREVVAARNELNDAKTWMDTADMGGKSDT